MGCIIFGHRRITRYISMCGVTAAVYTIAKMGHRLLQGLYVLFQDGESQRRGCSQVSPFSYILRAPQH